MTFKTVKLPLGFAGLEPYISKDQMQTHYEGHYVKYVETVNELCKQLNLTAESYEDLIVQLNDRIDESPELHKLYRSASQAYNHELFWDSLSDNFHDHIEQYEHLYELVESQYESSQAFIKEFTSQLERAFASNWVTLEFDTKESKLQWVTYHDEGTPFVHHTHCIPLLTVDVWEHAYYVQFKSDRADYGKKIIPCLNWKNVDQILKNLKISTRAETLTK